MDPQQQQPNLPRDAKLISLILNSMNVKDYDPKVLLMLMDFAHRYVTETLQDALTYADHAGRGNKVRLDDVRLAIETKINHEFQSVPGSEHMQPLATKLNSRALPLLPQKHGIRIPGDKTAASLTGTSFNLAISRTKRDLAAETQQQEPLLLPPPPPTASTTAGTTGQMMMAPPPAAMDTEMQDVPQDEEEEEDYDME